MARYLIGDVHGCGDELELLLAKLDFNKSRDTLYLAGDLIGKGKKPLKVLQIAQANDARLVLGNWDLALLAVLSNNRKPQPNYQWDAFSHLDNKELAYWQGYAEQIPFAQVEDEFILVHAGLMPHWTADDVKRIAAQAQDLHKVLHPEYLNERWITTRLSLHSSAEERFYVEAISVFTFVRMLQMHGLEVPNRTFGARSFLDYAQNNGVSPFAVGAKLQAVSHSDRFLRHVNKDGTDILVNGNPVYVPDTQHFFSYELSSPLLQEAADQYNRSGGVFFADAKLSDLPLEQALGYSYFAPDEELFSGKPFHDYQKGLFPWYEKDLYLEWVKTHAPERLVGNSHNFSKLDRPVFFGHWSHLNGVELPPGYICSDTSCCYGDRLTAYRLPDLNQLVTEPAALMALAQPIASQKYLGDEAVAHVEKTLYKYAGGDPHAPVTKD